MLVLIVPFICQFEQFRDINTLLSLFFSTKFCSGRQFKNQLNQFQLFQMKPVKAKCKFEKENRQNPLNTISIVSFLQTRLFKEKFSRTGTIHPGIFRGRELWVDSVSPPKNTIVSCERFKPIRIGENLVVNYKG